MPEPEIAIVSASLGKSDLPKHPVEQDVPVEWVYLTDWQFATAPWQNVKVPWQEGTARLRAKRFKMLPPVARYRYVIWIDASTEVKSPSFAREAVASISEGVAVFRHPRRDCIFEEYLASVGPESQGDKYAGEPLKEQVRSYQLEGYPRHNGLYACGTIAWDTRSREFWELGSAWHRECQAWSSTQDQLSFPVCCWRLGITPGTFPFPQLEPGLGYFGNRWQRIWPHETPVVGSLV